MIQKQNHDSMIHHLLECKSKEKDHVNAIMMITRKIVIIL